MTGRLSMRGLLMTYELEAASPRLAVSGTGRIELNDEMDAELSFRVTDTSLDPYLRVLQPTFSPFTSAIASGTIRVVGELYNPDALRIDTNIEEVNLRAARLPPAQSIADSVERRAPGAAGRCAEDGRRRHRARSERLGQPGRSVAGAAGEWRGEPRRAAGIPARHPQLGPRRSHRAHQRHRRGAGRGRQRAAHQRPHAAAVVPARARGGERHRDLRRRRPAPRRHHRPARRRRRSASAAASACRRIN